MKKVEESGGRPETSRIKIDFAELCSLWQKNGRDGQTTGHD